MGTSIIFYLFFAGVAGGAYLAAAAYDVLFGPARFGGPYSKRSGLRHVDSFMQTGYAVAPVAAAFAGAFLLADMGRADRVAQVLISPFSSLSSFGAASLAGFALASVATLVVLLVCKMPGLGLGLLKAAGCVLALFTIGYTGFLLMGLKAHPFWDNPLLPVVFLVSSLCSGISACLIAGLVAKPGGRSPADDWFWRLLSVLMLIELLVLGAFVAVGWLHGTPASQASVSRLVVGDMAPLFLLGVVVLGLIAPLASHVHIRGMRKNGAILYASICELSGALLLRAVIVMASVRALDVALLCYTSL